MSTVIAAEIAKKLIHSQHWAKFLDTTWESSKECRSETAFVEMFSQGSRLLNAVMLKIIYPYLFRRVVHDNIILREAHTFDFGNFGTLSALSPDALVKVLVFLTETELAKSVAPVCVGLKLFIASPSMLHEVCGERFALALSVLYSREDLMRDRFIHSIEAIRIDDFIHRVESVNHMITKAGRIGLQLDDTAQAVGALSEFFAANRDQEKLRKRLKEIVRALEVLNKDRLTTLIRILSCVQIVGSVLDGNSVDDSSLSSKFSFESLNTLSSIKSRFQNDFTAAHQIVTMSNVTLADWGHLEWALRQISDRAEPQENPNVWMLLELTASDVQIRSIVNRFRRIERRVREASPKNPFCQTLSACCEMNKSRLYQCETMAERARELLNTASLFDLRGIHNVRQVKSEFVSLSKFISGCHQIAVSEQPSLQQLNDALSNALQHLSIAAQDRQDAISQRKSMGPPSPRRTGNSASSFREARERVQNQMLRRTQSLQQIRQQRHEQVQNYLQQSQLNVAERRRMLQDVLRFRSEQQQEQMLGGQQQEPTSFLDSWTTTQIEAKPNSLKKEKHQEEQENDVKQDGTDAKLIKTKTWKPAQLEPVLESCFTNLWAAVDSTSSSARFGHIERQELQLVFSIGPNLHQTKTVQSGIRKQHFTLEHFQSTSSSVRSLSANLAEVEPDPPKQIFTFAQIQAFISSSQTEKYGLNRSFLEQYLTPDEFHSVFNMSRQEFNQLPKWKQLNLKKLKQLF